MSFLQNIGKVSKVAKSMAMWVIAMDEFSKVYKDVEPKIKKASEAEAVLKEVNIFQFFYIMFHNMQFANRF